MAPTNCVWVICFIPLPKDGQKFFGFAEFLAALALMVLAWTIADVRYKFRIRTAPIPLYRITFWVVATVGILTLLTDLWRAESWPIPVGSLLSPSTWQALLGGAVLLTFIAWVWFAFMRPSIFGAWNAKRYSNEIYGVILRGAPNELSEIADELGRSAGALIGYSWQANEEKHQVRQRGISNRVTTAKQNATAILQLIADRQFCHYVVEMAPTTVHAFADEAERQQKYEIPLGTFAKNITSEAIRNGSSFIYREVAGYDTGYLGHHKPLTSALYGNYLLMTALDMALDVDYRERDRWKPDQWEAFCRIVLMTFKSYVNSGLSWNHSFILFRAFDYIKDSFGNVRSLDDSNPNWWKEDCAINLNAAMQFATEAIKILESLEDGKVPYKLRRKEKDFKRDVYDLVAGLMYEMVFAASYVTKSQWTCWSIQHNSVWGMLFSRLSSDSKAWKIVRHKLRRLIYSEIRRMTDFPNYKGARILGLVLNVSWLTTDSKERSSFPILKATMNWVKRHYVAMAHASPKVAASCLVEGVAYDEEAAKLVKTGMEFLDREPTRNVLTLDTPAVSVSPRVKHAPVARRRKLPKSRLFG